MAVGGNVGHALAGMPGAIAADATVVAELSSFQLEHIERFRPDVAVLLNLTEDHLDRHGTYRGYVDAKLRIFENQTAGDVALLCADDPGMLAELAAGRLGGGGRRAVVLGRRRAATPAPAASRSSPASSAGGALWLDAGGARRGALRRARELALRGEHNLQNSLAAAAAACALGVPPASAAETLRTFAGVPHRLQVAGVVDGVTYVNDSKATNVDATLKALTAYSGGVHLILGRLRQGRGLRRARRRPPRASCKQALLIGATAPQLEAAFAAQAGGAAGVARPRRGWSAATSRRPSCSPRARRRRATSSCSARPARAGTSIGITSSEANTSSSL